MQNKLRDAKVNDDALHTVALASTQVVSVVRLLGLLPRCCRDASFPAADWEKVHQPVLLVYGELDKQVPPALSARMITNALERGGNRAYNVHAFSGANHAIVMAKTGFESELASAATVRIVPGYLDAMTSWVRARVAGEPPPPEHGWRPKVVEPVADVEHPPWHARPAVQLNLWGIFLAVFSATLTSRLLPRLLRRPRTQADPDPAVRRTQRLAVGVGTVNVSVAAGIVLVLGQFFVGQPLPSLWTALRLLALTSAFLAMALVVAMRRSWRSSWRGRGRARYGAVTVAAAAFVPFLAYWRLLPSLPG